MSARKESEGSYRPCLILALRDASIATETERSVRRRGWDVYKAQTGPEVRRLARMLSPDMVALDTELPAESGWLTCAKLVREQPTLPVVLIGDTDHQRCQVFATFVGARALLNLDQSAEGLLREMADPPLPAAS